MKKAMGVVWVVLLLIGLAMTGYADMTKKPVTAADLASLKGKWKGERVILGSGTKFPVDMEIVSGKLPLKGKLTLYNVMREGSKGRTVVFGLDKSELTKDGKLLIKGERFQVELLLSTEGNKMELQGDHKFEELNGKLFLTKK
ncbi:MAG: hypothetical protein HY787_09470 [Deltaproteobacteria bacterium]|nr:hypothetical protein [Deltaproteobacteria bacterium]